MDGHINLVLMLKSFCINGPLVIMNFLQSLVKGLRLAEMRTVVVKRRHVLGTHSYDALANVVQTWRRLLMSQLRLFFFLLHVWLRIVFDLILQQTIILSWRHHVIEVTWFVRFFTEYSVVILLLQIGQLLFSVISSIVILPSFWSIHWLILKLFLDDAINNCILLVVHIVIEVINLVVIVMEVLLLYTTIKVF